MDISRNCGPLRRFMRDLYCACLKQGTEHIYGSSVFNNFSIYNSIDIYSGVGEKLSRRRDAGPFALVCAPCGDAGGHPLPLGDLIVDLQFQIMIGFSYTKNMLFGPFNADGISLSIMNLRIIR